MPAPKGQLTNLPELSAYVIAHAAGFAWALAVNPMIFRSLVAQGYRDHLLLAAIAISVAVSTVVLLIFLVLRKAMTGTAAPPPADRPAPPAKFTDLTEIVAYVLAHGGGIAWGALVNPIIFRSLIEQGYRDHLALLGAAIGIAVSVVVLLLFLGLRKMMTLPALPT